MRSLPHEHGASLIEVMMSVLVFSVGLIGLAGLMMMATRSNHAAYLRTQVTFLASNMANRMSANPVGVWNGSYNSHAYPVSDSAPGCGSGAGCGPVALAMHDQMLWSRQLKTFLPNPSATIQCGGGASVGYDATPQFNLRPPYGGNCAMSISWSESGTGDESHRGNVTQTFGWEFQP
ncbi:type IV pilus modification protein PilV [Rhodanobacter sp. C03]|uniref:type IV pilus modification protein PilV n=1 Tax=Rhodanobacter sp. C03 TaxID=1945858 RepID=UPI0009849DCA|nr:type IV pilus modification protein PilV [Rhodanobacter sp. C03]OOG57267.1 type IV pilus modification protein PilV [Rhodanobacter sp. C03]